MSRTALAFVKMLRQHDDLANDLRQLAIVLLVEVERHFIVAGFLSLGNVLVIERVLRVVFLQRVETENHIFRRHRLAVMPARIAAQLVGCRGEIVRVGNRFGDLAVFGGRFVEASGHKLVIDQRDAGRLLALVGNEIQAVESADRGEARGAALGRVGIHVIEMLEVGAVFRLADQRGGVPRFVCLRACGQQKDDRGGGQDGQALAQPCVHIFKSDMLTLSVSIIRSDLALEWSDAIPGPS